MLAIADRAHDDGSAWMSLADIKRRTNLGDRGVQGAVVALTKLGELEVGYQQGPKGCNTYRIVGRFTPAKSAPPQSLRGAEIAPPQSLRPSESSQVNPEDPAKSAPPADSAPPQNHADTPANSADKPIEPSKEVQVGRAGKSRREDADRICSHLADRIEANSSTGKRPTITQRWRDTARLMIDRDGLSEDRIHRAIDWCQDDEFWRLNIKSMPKLRDHYDRLQQEAQRRARSGNGHAAPGPDRARGWVAAGRAFQEAAEQAGRESA